MGFGVALAAMLVAAVPASAQEMEDVEIRTVYIRSGVAMLVGRGGNIGVSTGPDGTFLIDDQYAPLAPRIRRALELLDPHPVRFVINTHWHGDHTGGNEPFATGGALVLAHENVRERMSTEQFIAALDRRVPASPAAALPVVTFASSVTLHLNGQTVRAIHVGPAHTDGDVIVHFSPANVIHTGDVYVAGMYPFVDLSSGGRLAGYLDAAERILALADGETKIIPGHGPVSSRAELAEWRAMLADVSEEVEQRIAAGLSLEEIVAARPTAGWDERYGDGFVKPDDFVRLVHQSLTRTAAP
jgi:glyoxylase-like metal-dependent hydrolase (beta-lactamase superfamily II)